MQKPQLVYKLDEAKNKVTRSILSPANIRNRYFTKLLVALFTRWAYACFGPLVTAVGLRLIYGCRSIVKAFAEAAGENEAKRNHGDSFDA